MRRNLVMLVTLALLWGASFMFIKIADRQLAPSTLILGRLGLGALTLAVIVPFTVGWRQTVAATKENWFWLLVVALLNTALPFWLLSWGETRISSGLASIVQGAVPIFNALFAFAFFREVRVTGLRLVGFALGFVGVALIVGGQPGGKVLGALAVVGMAVCYALGGLLMGRHLRGISPIIIALASTSIAAVADLPAGVLQAPHAWPGWRPVASVVVLGVPLLGFAYLLFFALITGPGAAYASLVTYLIPPIALAYGAIFLGEHFGALAFGGLVLILGGVALGTGAVALASLRGRRAEATEAA
ncbi:MAG TPA: DMT family transporter [Gaiellaceae bacterium]|nr:DMT family transporter [Gaiellaceae bacterium]